MRSCKRNGKAVRAALLSLALAAMLFGCAPADGFEGGRPLDQAELDSLRGELLTTQEESSGAATEPSGTGTATDTETSAEEETPTESVTDGETAPTEIETTPVEIETTPAETASAEDTAESETVAASGKVYWTKGGSVYHRDRDCYHLKKSQSVSEGSVEQAVSLGKGRLCASCEKKTSP